MAALASESMYAGPQRPAPSQVRPQSLSFLDSDPMIVSLASDDQATMPLCMPWLESDTMDYTDS